MNAEKTVAQSETRSRPPEEDEPTAPAEDAATYARKYIHESIDELTRVTPHRKEREKVIAPLLDALDQLSWLEVEMKTLLNAYEALGGDDAVGRLPSASGRPHPTSRGGHS